MDIPPAGPVDHQPPPPPAAVEGVPGPSSSDLLNQFFRSLADRGQMQEIAHLTEDYYISSKDLDE